MLKAYFQIFRKIRKKLSKTENDVLHLYKNIENKTGIIATLRFSSIISTVVLYLDLSGHGQPLVVYVFECYCAALQFAFLIWASTVFEFLDSIPRCSLYLLLVFGGFSLSRFEIHFQTSFSNLNVQFSTYDTNLVSKLFTTMI